MSPEDGVEGVAKALLVAPITAALQAAEVLDDVRAAFTAGNTQAALAGLASLPILVGSAFINGFTPAFSNNEPWPGLFGNGGPFDFFIVDLPRVVAAGLTAPVTTADAALSKVASVGVVPPNETVTLDLNRTIAPHDAAQLTAAVETTGTTTVTDETIGNTGGETGPADDGTKGAGDDSDGDKISGHGSDDTNGGLDNESGGNDTSGCSNSDGNDFGHADSDGNEVFEGNSSVVNNPGRSGSGTNVSGGSSSGSTSSGGSSSGSTSSGGSSSGSTSSGGSSSGGSST